MSRDPRLLLADIVEACDDVAAIVAGIAFQEFTASVEKVAAIERKIFVIGEGAARLPEEFRDQHEHVPWPLIIGMRNILAHAYWQIDRTVLWNAATQAVPALLTEVRRILGESA